MLRLTLPLRVCERSRVPLNIPFKIETYPSLTSTQDAMRERLTAGDDVHGLVIRALEQTGARGQRKRDWVSGLGGSYQTLAVRDNDASLKQPYAAIAVATGLAQALPEYGIRCQVKWPNDLYYREKKVAGILCEYAKSHLLVGVGMNVNNEVPAGAASLRGLDVEGVSTFVLAGVQQGLELLAGGDDLASAFAPFDLLKDREVTVTFRNEPVRGVARGLDENGCLRLETDQGIRSVCQGEARVRLQRPA